MFLKVTTETEQLCSEVASLTAQVKSLTIVITHFLQTINTQLLSPLISAGITNTLETQLANARNPAQGWKTLQPATNGDNCDWPQS